MILLRNDCLVFEMSNGDKIPCAASTVTVELLGSSAELVDREVIEHATWNGARLLGMEERLGKVREGFIADLLVVNGNPLDNLKLLSPAGADIMLLNGTAAPNTAPIGPSDKVQPAHGGGMRCTQGAGPRRHPAFRRWPRSRRDGRRRARHHRPTRPAPARREGSRRKEPAGGRPARPDDR